MFVNPKVDLMDPRSKLLDTSNFKFSPPPLTCNVSRDFSFKRIYVNHSPRMTLQTFGI